MSSREREREISRQAERERQGKRRREGEREGEGAGLYQLRDRLRSWVSLSECVWERGKYERKWDGERERERERKWKREKELSNSGEIFSFIPEVGLPDQDTAPERFGWTDQYGLSARVTLNHYQYQPEYHYHFHH